jgi:plastocyanin
VDPDVGSARTRSGVGDPWRWVIAGAAVVTAGCAAFAVAAAVTSDDGSDTSTLTTGGENGEGERVEIIDFSFEPAVLTVDVGTTVNWTNEDSTTHSVVDRGGTFASPDLAPGASFSMRSDEAGTYEYVCGIHPSMTGTVTVEE